MTGVLPSRRPSSDAPPAETGFEAIYAEHFDYVWHTLRRLGVAAADLEDVAHDVFVVVHRRLDDYDPRRPVRPWLFGICYRTASSRRRRFRTLPPSTVEPVDVGPTPDAALVAIEARRQVAAALDTMNLEQRAVVVMHDIDEQPAPAIAEALGVPVNTVYSRLRLGRQKLAQALRANEDRE